MAVEPRELLIHTLRERLAHTGPHIGCETSHCGACTVDVDGMSLKSCTVLTVQCDGAEMLTVEGLEQGGVLHALQQAFHEEHGLQCGYCTPGMLTRAYRLLQENPNPSEAGDPLRHRRQPVPLHRLPEHRQGGAVGGEEAGAAAAGGLKRHHAERSHRRPPMGDMSELQEREDKLQGMGTSLLRKEDAKFIRGQGSYVDDIKLPGMLFGAIVRSPYAHARIKSIDKSKALACPGVVAVLTADDLKPVNLHWMPTLGGDVQAVLADKKVCFQMQEVAMVLATDRYARRRRRGAGRGRLRGTAGDRRPEAGDGAGRADHPRGHRRQDRGRPRPAHPPEPHLHLGGWRQGGRRRGLRRRRGHGARGDPEPARAPLPARDLRLRRVVQQGHRLPDGLHDDAGAAPACAPCWRCCRAWPKARSAWSAATSAAASATRCRCTRATWSRSSPPSSPACRSSGSNRASTTSRTTGFARDYHGVGELAADADGRIKGLRFTALADHGAFNSHVSATKLPAGLFSICTGSYAIPNAYCRVDAVYTNKAPGGVAYRCSLRVTEAVYLIERMIDVLALKLGIDKAEIRRRNFVKAEQFPYTTSFGWTLDSGAYHAALEKVLKAVDYEGLRREQAAKRADPNCPTLMGIGLATFTEIVGAGPTKVCDILGIGLFDSCEIRVHPTGGVIARLGTMTQGQGHATTYAQIIATELGLPARDIVVEEGDTDKAPYGAGTWGSRSTPVSGAATAQAARKIKDKAQEDRRPPARSRPRATSNGRSTASRSRATRARPRP